jgi:ABC-type transport system involved in multi-copper enzyme maturation permease subunit
MFIIARHQLFNGMSDAKFLFAALFVLLSFIVNGILYSEKIVEENADVQRLVATTNRDIVEASASLQDVSDLDQLMIKPYSTLSFVADDGTVLMPNSLEVDAFTIGDIRRNNSINQELPVLPPLDWTFIVTHFMSLVCILLAYDSICGEKQDGTLRQILSHPISRLSIFTGKFLGLLATVTILLILGSLLSLTILLFENALTISFQVVLAILWAELLSIILLSLFILISMLISSLAAQPRVSLITLMVIWVVIVIIIPGVTGTLGEQITEIPSSVETRAEMRAQLEELWDNAPEGAGSWNGDPFAEWMPARKEQYDKQRRILQNKTREIIQLKIQQVKNSDTLTWISPTGMFKTFMQEISNTGVYGFENLYLSAQKYVTNFEDYVRQQDANDADSAHLVYSTGGSVEQGTFSVKPVDPSTVPRWTEMWSAGGLPREEKWPAMQLIILVMLSTQIALLAFWAFHRYDPR